MYAAQLSKKTTKNFNDIFSELLGNISAPIIILPQGALTTLYFLQA